WAQGDGLPRFYPDMVFIVAYFDEAGLYFDEGPFVFVADIERSAEHGDGEVVGVDFKRVVFVRGYLEECFACQRHGAVVDGGRREGRVFVQGNDGAIGEG